MAETLSTNVAKKPGRRPEPGWATRTLSQRVSDRRSRHRHGERQILSMTHYDAAGLHFPSPGTAKIPAPRLCSRRMEPRMMSHTKRSDFGRAVGAGLLRALTHDIIALILLMLVAVPAQPQQAVSSMATRNLKTLVGKDDWAKLPVRLQELNGDIRSQGLHDFPGATGKMLTGYKYGEYYDWDIYFEN